MKLLAKISIIVQVLLVAMGVLDFFRVKSVLTSPLIPEQALLDAAIPYLIVGLIVVPFTIITYVLFKKQRYAVCVIIGCLMLVWQFMGYNYL